MLPECARVRYLLARAVRVDDAHERIQAHVDAASLLQRFWNVGIVIYLHDETHLMGAVRMLHDVNRARRGRQVACPANLDPPYFREGEETPLASVRVLDLESRGLSELGGLLAVPPALVARQPRAAIPPVLLLATSLVFPAL